ncbi:hypothetical protein [Streptomyces fagopyri]|uniref:hypothetical protein n=1 Tax=Streptomyces fagopyri TaxID=2662397 RepID=UPI00372101D6
MTDGIAWLAAPQSIAFGGYGVVLARGLDSEELVTRLTATVFGPTRTTRGLGRLTNKELNDAVEDGPWAPYPTIGLRHGKTGEWNFVVKYGGWQAEFGSQPSVSRDGAHVFGLEFEEENGKPVPPQFSYLHDDRLMCAFNVHLDRSWGFDGVSGDREVAVGVEEMLAAAGLPDTTVPRREVHRTTLEIIGRYSGLSLPRRQVLEDALPAVVLEIA